MFDLGNLDDLSQTDDEREYSCQWNQFKTEGKHPGNISHHSSVVHEDKMFVFGGNTVDIDNEGKLYELDVDSLTWSLVQFEGTLLPCTRDEHTAVLYQGKMYVFGGFKRGVRTNSVLVFDFATSTWERELEAADFPGGVVPIPRAGHSACVHGDNMYVFGGKDEENEKVKDFWKFSFADSSWEQLPSPDASIAPRSGHSCCSYGPFLVIFGGIQEITKELDDLIVYNFNTSQWVTVFHPFKENLDNGT
jgi:N-acetylneuraminic acid mutarotase